jgi:AraC family transcriptional regulator
LTSQKLYIKHMVCDRCKKVVRDELQKLNIPVQVDKLGEATLMAIPSEHQLSLIREVLQKNGFELLDDKRARLIEQIKTLIIHQVHQQKEGASIQLSDFLHKEIGKDYSYLSALFSETEGITIEKYHILQRLERVKELLVYDELSLKEIAYLMGYSSVAHLSAQFKKETGLTPGHFKKFGVEKRFPLDKVGQSYSQK